MTFSVSPPAPQVPAVIPPTKPPERISLAPPASVDPTLVKILSWKRPHESKSEHEFGEWLFEEVKRRGGAPDRMANGNIVVCVLGLNGLMPTTLFSCHVDTVHNESAGKQSIVYDASFGHIFLDKTDSNRGSCLGADDGAGVWIMLEMLQQGVPGVYVFHRGEERGGLGSRDMLRLHAAWLEKFDAAVAFDRPGTHEVITHQGGQRCASDKAGNWVVTQLAKHGLAYQLSDRGVFTDTKIYRNVIAECFNLGVGYCNQHGQDEYLDYDHLVELRDAVVLIDWESMVIDRDPKAVDPYHWRGYGGGHNIYPYSGRVGGTGQQHSFRGNGFSGPWPGEEYDFDALDERPPAQVDAPPPGPQVRSPAPPPDERPEVPEAYDQDSPTIKLPTLVEELQAASMVEIEEMLESLGGEAVHVICELVATIRGLQAELEQIKEYMRR